MSALDDLIDQVVEVLAELAAEPTHRERAQPFVVEKLQSGVDDLGPVQWCASHNVDRSLQRFLAEPRSASLAYSRRDGSPFVVPVRFQRRLCESAVARTGVRGGAFPAAYPEPLALIAVTVEWCAQ